MVPIPAAAPVPRPTLPSAGSTLDAALVAGHFDASLKDLSPQAIKTGTVGTSATARVIAAQNFARPLVIDPLMTFCTRFDSPPLLTRRRFSNRFMNRVQPLMRRPTLPVAVLVRFHFG
jgi:Phosphomethylpyrimidine kinase